MRKLLALLFPLSALAVQQWYYDPTTPGMRYPTQSDCPATCYALWNGTKYLEPSVSTISGSALIENSTARAAFDSNASANITKDAAVRKAKNRILFGSTLAAEVQADNIGRGLTNAQRKTFLASTQDVLSALMAGSLEAALSAIDNLTPSDPILPSNKIAEFRAKIDAYISAE